MMRLTVSAVASLLLLSGLIGCQSTAPAESGKASANKVDAPAGGSGQAGSGSTATPPQTKVEIPLKLQNAAFEYYGLGVATPVNIEVSDSLQGTKRTGTRTVSPVAAEGGKVSFSIKQSGALEDQGDIVVSLEEGGVYAMSSSKGQMKPHTLEMPSNVAPGTAWEDQTELKTSQGDIKLLNKVKAEKLDRVKTQVGSYNDALYVTSTGSGTISGKKGTLTTQSWYVKGRGAVRQIITVKVEGMAERTISMEEIP